MTDGNSTFDLSKFEETKINLHSESLTVIQRKVGDDLFKIAATNGRTRIWAERFHEIEPELIAWCANLGPKDILWDLGASIGHFANFAAIVSGCRVYAFEPEAQNFGQCALNHFLNYARVGDRVIPLNFGVAEKRCLADMYIRLYGAGEHTKSLTPSSTTYKNKVLLLGIPDVLALGIPSPTAIKIDVDGSEAAVVSALAPVWAQVQKLFIELPMAEEDYFGRIFASHGLRLASTHLVKRMSGGTYDAIINAIFVR